jgi:beta-lactamase class A
VILPLALVLFGSAAAAEPPAAPKGLPPPEAALFEKLEARIAATDRALDGLLGVSLKDLKTGATLELRPEETFPTASSIKAAVLYDLYRQAGEGRIDLDGITRPGGQRVKGGGALEVLSDRVSLTWRDLGALMFAFSDNEATNLLVRRLGLDAINRRLQDLGLGRTRMRRLMMDLEAARRGEENVSTPAELRRLMEELYSGTGLAPEAVLDLRRIATLPKDSPFRLPLPEGLPVADKPGSLEAVRCVGAVVDLPGRPYSVALMTSYLRQDADGEAALRELSAAIFETFDRLARASEYGRIVSER